MCGIAGWLDFGQDIRDRRHVVEAMTVTLAARGPDGQGVWVDTHVGLGHRRLAVIDLAGGLQPMVHGGGTDATVALSYNGEIYNFAALRVQLEGLGHRFTTRCDTEVVLRGYLQWQEGVVRRLEGMFAFAIWDARRQQLLLARDFLGVKPLYFQRIGKGVVFGSEPKALLAHPDIRARTNEDGLREIFVLARTPGRTPYAGIHEVKPGEMLRFGREGMRADRFWNFEARPHEDDLPATIARVGELLENAVRQQIVSDVPLCTLLSGGLDSSAIAAMRARRRTPSGPIVRSEKLWPSSQPCGR